MQSKTFNSAIAAVALCNKVMAISLADDPNSDNLGAIPEPGPGCCLLFTETNYNGEHWETCHDGTKKETSVPGWLDNKTTSWKCD